MLNRLAFPDLLLFLSPFWLLKQNLYLVPLENFCTPNWPRTIESCAKKTKFLFFQGNASVNSSRSSTPTQQVTKVTATAKFKVEVHTPGNTIERPVSSRSGRRSKESLSSSGSVHSSLSGDSVRSSLSSNDGDAGFSEK